MTHYDNPALRVPSATRQVPASEPAPFTVPTPSAPPQAHRPSAEAPSPARAPRLQPFTPKPSTQSNTNTNTTTNTPPPAPRAPTFSPAPTFAPTPTFAAAPAAPNTQPQTQPMDTTHAMDWDVLDLGHPAVSCTEVALIDLEVQVFGLEEIRGGERDVAVILVAHGWANKAQDMHPMASGLIGEFARLDAVSGRERTRDVLVVTLDQRNHGARRRIKDKTSWNSSPRGYAIYMAMAVTGGVHDHKMIMDFLPNALFPKDERRIVAYMSTGFSMGGHVLWRLLREDPRITTVVPICSIPSEMLRLRLLTSPLPPGTEEAYVPENIREWYYRPVAEGVYASRRILALYGGHDRVIPWQLGAQRWDEIVPLAAAAERWIDDGAGHKVSAGMVGRAAEWFWRWELTEERA